MLSKPRIKALLSFPRRKVQGSPVLHLYTHGQGLIVFLWRIGVCPSMNKLTAYLVSKFKPCRDMSKSL